MRITLIYKLCLSTQPGVIVTLADLKRGQTALIESIDTTMPGVVRLMVLGLIEGASICFVNAAIGGDPLEISVHGASLSVRRQQAVHFHVAITGPGL